MSDLSALERETLAAIEGAPDESALEATRVAALGKKGSISALLATLGKLAPDERKTQGAAINALKDQVSEALAARRALLKRARARDPAQARDPRRHAARGPARRRNGAHPSDQPGDGRDHRHFRRDGFFGRRRAGHRERRLQFHQAQLPARPSGARDARHVLSRARRARASGRFCAPTRARCRCARC